MYTVKYQVDNPSPVMRACIASRTGLLPDPTSEMVPSSMYCES